MNEIVSAGVGTASLASDSDDDGPYTIHGVAIGADDITVGKSKTKKRWTPEALKKAAETLEGNELVKDHQNDVDGTIGTVTKSKYREGVGVLYEAEIAEHYDEIAQDIASGILDVSPRIYHKDPEELEVEDGTGAYVIGENDIGPFDNLSVVSDGASPSNTAEIGEASTLESGAVEGSVATLEAGSDRLDTDEISEELRHPGHAREDTSDMPRKSTDEAPEWEEGDMVRWQVEPDLFGKIVHNDETKNVVMVEIMGMSDGEMQSTGFTITAGYSDIKPLKTMQDVEDADLSKWSKKERMASDTEMPSVDELASINGLDINGTVMWDDNMGVLSGFEQDDGQLMAEIDMIEQDDGQFEKTGETVMEPMTEVMDAEENAEHSAEQSADDDADEDAVAELESAWHTPDWSGLDDSKEWSKPSMEDFDTDDLGEIDDHFFVSKTGEWPPKNYGDLALPAVWPSGELSLDGLDSVHQMAGQTDGVSDDMAESIKSKANSLAEEHFDQPVADEEMSNMSGGSESNSATIQTAMISDDDARFGGDGQSTLVSAASLSQSTNTEIMTEIEYEEYDTDEIEEMSDPVVLEQDDVESLANKASEANELQSKLDDMNSSLEELASNQDALDEVDEAKLEELREYDDAVVLPEDEHEELTNLVDSVGSIYADELEDHGPFTAEELTERWTPMELKDRVEDHEDASISELSNEEDVEPEGGSASEAELEDGNEEAEKEQTVEELRDEAASKLEDVGYDRQAEKVRNGDIPLDEIVDA